MAARSCPHRPSDRVPRGRPPWPSGKQDQRTSNSPLERSRRQAGGGVPRGVAGRGRPGRHPSSSARSSPRRRSWMQTASRSWWRNSRATTSRCARRPSKELAKFGPAAFALARKARADSDSPEVRTRLDRVMKGWTEGAFAPEVWRAQARGGGDGNWPAPTARLAQAPGPLGR